jgi:hypothetical protein
MARRKYRAFLFTPRLKGEEFYYAEFGYADDGTIFSYGFFESIGEFNEFARRLGAEICKIKTHISSKNRKPGAWSEAERRFAADESKVG